MGVLAIGFMSMTTSLCKTVWAERFVLRDSSMRDRMVIDAYSTAQPTISFKDEKGKVVARLQVDGDGGAGLVTYSKGKPASRTWLWQPGTESEADRKESESGVLF